MHPRYVFRAQLLADCVLHYTEEVVVDVFAVILVEADEVAECYVMDCFDPPLAA